MELISKEIVLLSKNAIVMAVSKEKETEPVPTNARKIPVELVLRSGETLRGDVHNDLPKTHSRLSDYLNHTDAFFHIEVGALNFFVSNGFVRLMKPADPNEAHVSR
jgi:hypothetical protein